MNASEEIAVLRDKGLTPKEIARQLKMKPAEVTALIQQRATRLSREAGPVALAPVVGCYVSAGWSQGLGLRGAPEGLTWGDETSGNRGLVGVLLAREHRHGNVIVCGYLVDVFCLGVKNTLGPKQMAPDELGRFTDRYFSTFRGERCGVSVGLAQCLVHGAVAYARSLGFEPHPDFARSEPLLGTYDKPNFITFGENGRPHYISGPHDHPMQIVSTLRRTVGDGKFDMTLIG